MLTKRVVDIAVSAVGLLLSAPITLLTLMAIKLDRPGLIFYRQERVGEDDETFTIYKFRSMFESAEANLSPVWAAEEDPRVTRVEKLIRKLRIDEIPQMINVRSDRETAVRSILYEKYVATVGFADYI